MGSDLKILEIHNVEKQRARTKNGKVMLPFNLKLSERRRGQGGNATPPHEGRKINKDHPIVGAAKKDLEDMLVRFHGRLAVNDSIRDCRRNASGQYRRTTTGNLKATNRPRYLEQTGLEIVDPVLDPNHADHQVGNFFGIFKDEFSSSKGGMFHNLCPSRCNREAYSQMLYSLCLTILKEALCPNSSSSSTTTTTTTYTTTTTTGSDDSEDSDNDHTTVDRTRLEKSGFGVFALYALWETNPLPRAIDNDKPLGNLTMGLLDPENPRALHRRYFHQDIRIDRSHFVLMLRLREIALFIQSRCEGEFYDSKYQQLKQRQEQRKSKSARSSLSRPVNSKEDDKRCIGWKCSCGLATDILEVIERLFPKLKLCEYIGPIGLESLAWNPDYNYKFRQTAREKCDGSTVNNSKAPHQIDAFIDEYKACIDTIRSARDSKSDDKQVNEATATTESDERNNEILKDLFASMSDDDTAGSGKEKSDDSHSSNLDHTKNNDEVDGHQQNNALEKERTNGSVENNLSPIKLKYDFLVPKEMNSDHRQRLTMCLKKLAERERATPPFQLPVQPKDKSLEERIFDDVSSIGYGGVASVATSLGRNALQNLLSQVQKEDDVDIDDNRKFSDGATRRKSDCRSKQHTPIGSMVNDFLASTNDDDAHRRNPRDGDDETVDSEVTFDSSQMDDDDSDADADEIVSVATSAVGRRALKDLLGTVTATTGKSKTRKNHTPRKRLSQSSQSQSRKRKKEARTRAVNSGQNALSQLLQKALDPSSDRENNGKNEESDMDSVSGGGYDDDDDSDNNDEGQEGREDFISITESVPVGPGRRALDDLLSSLKK